MKIVGGNFGVKGSAFLSRDNKLVVEGAQRAVYSPNEVLSVFANVTKEKKFGILGFIVGAVILSVILGILLNVIGVIIGAKWDRFIWAKGYQGGRLRGGVLEPT